MGRRRSKSNKMNSLHKTEGTTRRSASPDLPELLQSQATLRAERRTRDQGTQCDLGSNFVYPATRGRMVYCHPQRQLDILKEMAEAEKENRGAPGTSAASAYCPHVWGHNRQRDIQGGSGPSVGAATNPNVSNLYGQEQIRGAPGSSVEPANHSFLSNMNRSSSGPSVGQVNQPILSNADGQDQNRGVPGPNAEPVSRPIMSIGNGQEQIQAEVEPRVRLGGYPMVYNSNRQVQLHVFSSELRQEAERLALERDFLPLENPLQ